MGTSPTVAAQGGEKQQDKQDAARENQRHAIGAGEQAQEQKELVPFFPELLKGGEQGIQKSTSRSNGIRPYVLSLFCGKGKGICVIIKKILKTFCERGGDPVEYISNSAQEIEAVPLIRHLLRKWHLSLGEDRADHHPAARFGNPGAEIRLHQPRFWETQGPVARRESRKATQILRAGRSLPTQRDHPRKRGPGKGEYGHEVSILSRPRGRFGSFAATGKGTRRPGHGALKQKSCLWRRNIETFR